MEPEKVERNAETGVVEKVIFLYGDIEVSFIPVGNEVKESSRVNIYGGLLHGESGYIPGKIIRKMKQKAYQCIKEKENILKSIEADHYELSKGKGHNESEKPWLSLLADNKIYINQEGKILIPRKEPSGSTTIQSFQEIFSAIRCQRKILKRSLDGVVGEMKDISELQKLSTNLNTLILQIIKDPKEERSWADDVGNNVKAIRKELTRCRNHHKVKADQGFSNLETPIDSRGRKNTPSKAAQSVGAKNALGSRIREILKIAPYIIARKNILNNFRKHNNNSLREAKRILEGLRNIELDNKKKIHLETGKALHIVGWRLVEPYKSFAKTLKNEINLLKDNLRAGIQKDDYLIQLNSIIALIFVFLDKDQPVE
ncbi:hypothetical protein C0584_03070 [Candidatus Parcubacteria bacterium]|nr:MAG: hypothetical protein C0584_03070 [Candidatus Parcubacteria bacterium]